MNRVQPEAPRGARLPWGALGRFLVQLVLSGPLLALFPWALMMGAGMGYFLVTGDFHQLRELSKTVAYGFGWLGLLGLMGSMVTPAAWLRRTRWARRLLATLGGCGFLAAAAILLGGGLPRRGWDALWTLWLLGGPVVVGLWNLGRVFGPVRGWEPS